MYFKMFLKGIDAGVKNGEAFNKADRRVVQAGVKIPAMALSGLRVA